MSKNKLQLEYTLNSTSRNIIWQLIATAEGLERWIADRVSIDGTVMTFTWGDDWRHHECRTATLVACERYKKVRWKWDDEDDDSYVEIVMQRSVISGQYSLQITDFFPDDDEEWLQSTWQHNFKRLRRSSGV